ncbi:GNAT family N-acetyltransferase [Clostridium polynesiense]|uniref:GNAT family N-acetyltransferase n=1 Tax=Clostridium polynesiense TaxID=1325933 RepID=UPI00058F4EB8|nr:GNAT family N-acetyltransferase [Clostridium polynesiense]
MNYINITDEYAVCQANPTEWAKYHAIYRLSNLNELKSLTIKEDIQRYSNGDFCYWIVKGSKIVGGALIKPNLIKCAFMVPPFEAREDLARVIFEYSSSISDVSKEIIIPDAENDMERYWEGFGFRVDRKNKLMVGVTNKHQVIWNKKYKIAIPNEENAEEMAQLYYETYSKSPLKYISEQTLDFQIKSVDVFFNHIKDNDIPNYWSSLVYDSSENKLVGSCAVGLVNNLPFILDIVVHPDYQKNGLASNMVKRVSNLSYNNYPAVSLNVITGNDAELFYKKMGFVEFSETSHMMKTP